MNEKEVKAKIGAKNWPKFLDWMYGQTVGVNPTTNEIDFYVWDVDSFIDSLNR